MGWRRKWRKHKDYLKENVSVLAGWTWARQKTDKRKESTFTVRLQVCATEKWHSDTVPMTQVRPRRRQQVHVGGRLKDPAGPSVRPEDC